MPEHLPAVAYSYVRFSHPSQAKGDSLRRQTETTEAWCKRNGARLDTATTLHDLGKSAFKKKRRRGAEVEDPMAAFVEPEGLVNPDRRALAGFQELIKRRKVPRGAYLVIENLDRISRDDVVPATHLLTGILLAGVHIVQLNPVEQVLTAKSDGPAITMAVMELSRGNRESVLKSERVGKAWGAKWAAARERKAVATRRLPGWVEEVRGRLELIPDRAAVVRRIFALAAAGYGRGMIVHRLEQEGVPPFGRERWHRAYIGRILSERRAVGELQPRRGLRPDGDPVPGYFPAVVTEEEWLAARAGAAARRNLWKPDAPRRPLPRRAEGAPAGRRRGPGKAEEGNQINLWTGLLRNARRRDDGTVDTYVATTVVSGDGRTRRMLINRDATYARLHAKAYSFPLATFDRAILSELREIDPAEVLGTEDRPNEAAVLEGELARVRARTAELEAELLRGDVPALANAIRKLEDQKRDLTERLAAVRARAAHPLADSWREAQSLADLLDTAPDPADARLRLRAALQRVIDSIWMLVVRRGRDRICSAQVWFADGVHFRSYLIFHRAARANQARYQPGAWYVLSLLHPEAAMAGLPFEMDDLRDRDVADDLRSCFEQYPPPMIDELLAKGHPL